MIFNQPGSWFIRPGYSIIPSIVLGVSKNIGAYLYIRVLYIREHTHTYIFIYIPYPRTICILYKRSRLRRSVSQGSCLSFERSDEEVRRKQRVDGERHLVED